MRHPFLNIAIGSGYRGHPLNQTIHDRFYSIRDTNGFVALTQTQYDALTHHHGEHRHSHRYHH